MTILTARERDEVAESVIGTYYMFPLKATLTFLYFIWGWKGKEKQ